MFTIYSVKEWSKILTRYPKPCDEVKQDIWEKTREYPVPTVEITLDGAIEDFEELKALDTEPLIKTCELFSRYEYKWELGNNYIDSCNIGNKSSNYFHQDLRYKCDSINSPSPWRNWNEKKFFFTLCNALWSLKVKEVTSETLRSCIALRKYIASQFRPSAAKAIYDHFNAKNILDFSSGWGDRLSAAMASETVEEYVGIDPNKELYEGYQQQIRLFSNKNIMNIFLPAEEGVQTLKNFNPDLVFTSPPYFIIERYSKDSSQSWQRYKKIDMWLESFLFKTLSDSWDILKSGGHMAINISDVYCNHTINRICDPMNDFISTLKGAEKVDNINYKMAKRLNSKSDKKGIFVEPIWCWKKT
jgi:tRNA1(Val) A37 N6-methylase TrmN6